MAELRAGERIGRYQIIEQIGQGGMTAVYLAVDNTLSRRVIVKVLHAYFSQNLEFSQRFQREFSTLASLQHPNIVSLYDVNQTDDFTYLVAEYMDGGTLADAIGRAAKAGGRMEMDYGLQIILQAADGLSYAHDRSIIHRDVKPSNILLTSSGRAAISDFGIALYRGQPSLTEVGTVLGTPLYMSPEQVRAETVDARADIYSLGVVLFEVLTGKRPFSGDSPTWILMKVIQEPTPAPTQFNPAITPALEAVVMKAMAKEPKERFQTMAEFRAALDAASRNRPLPNTITIDIDKPRDKPGLLTRLKTAAGALVERLAGTESQPTAPEPDTKITSQQSETAVLENPPIASQDEVLADYATTEVLPHNATGYPTTLSLPGEAGIAWLLALSGPYRGRQYQIKDTVTIGRTTFELTQEDNQVSRQHARIMLRDGRFYIEDLGSSNGTLVNSARLPAGVAQQLQDRDEIRIGRTVMIFIQAVRPEDATGEARQRLKEFDAAWDELIQSFQE